MHPISTDPVTALPQAGENLLIDMRLRLGGEAFHKAIAQQFFGAPAQAQ